MKAHRSTGAAGSIALKRVDDPVEFGIVITHDDGSIERFLEKPTWGQVFSDTINTGIYVLEPEVFDFIPKGEVVDFSSDVFPAILKRGKPLYGYVAEGYWEDVGTLEAYLRAHQDILEGKVNLEIDGFRLGEDVWLGEGAEVDPDARIDGPAIIGVELPDRSRRARPRVHGARSRRRHEARRVDRPLGRARTRVSRTGSPVAGHGHRPVL